MTPHFCATITRGMIVFFEDTSFFNKLEQMFQRHQLPARGWRDYDDLEKRLREAQPKVILLDVEIGQQKEAGLKALEKIKDKFPRVKTIMLTGYPEHVFKAFRLGADGYVLKEELEDSLEYIQEIVKDANGGKVVMSEEVKKIMVAALRPHEKINLTNREIQILSLASCDKNVPQIAEILNLKKQTVETYLRNIRTKLDCHTIQGAVAKAIRAGLLTEVDR